MKHDNPLKDETRPTKDDWKNVDKAVSDNYFMNISYFHEYISLFIHKHFISSS